MTRLVTVTLCLGCFCLGVFLLPALSQTPEKPLVALRGSGASSKDAVINVMRSLKQPIDVAWLQTDEGEKFSKVCDVLAANWKINVMVDKVALEEGAEGAPNPYDQMVKLPPGSKTMPAELVLRLIVPQVGTGNRASYWIHPLGFVVVTSTKRLDARYSLYESSITANYDRRPLHEVLDDLSNQVGTPVYLDTDVGKKGDTLITALFNANTLEQVIVAVTETAHLKYAVLERGIFVTTPDNAKKIAAEERERTKARERFKKSQVEKPAA